MVKVEKYEPAQYPQAVKNTRHATGIILVYHPHCGHCVQLRPIWEQMKRQAPRQARIVEIDGSDMANNSDMAQSPIGQKTEGFPSIMRVKKGKVVESFQQERTVPKMLEFVKKSIQDHKTNKGKNKKAYKKTQKLKKK